MFKKGIKSNLSIKFIKIKNGILQKKFIKLYNKNMEKVNASKYYFFNTKYFNLLEKIKIP